MSFLITVDSSVSVAIKLVTQATDLGFSGFVNFGLERMRRKSNMIRIEKVKFY
jgi:hypothetical protein